MLLLRTVSGSVLYGLNHAGSDEDWFEVHTGKFKTKHNNDHATGLDVVSMSLDRFLTNASVGSHQSLEAMWSRQAEVDLMPWRFDFSPSPGEVVDRYERTIKKFSLEPSYKKQRHAWRLKFNLTDYLSTGRFDPTLDTEQREHVEWLVQRQVRPF